MGEASDGDKVELGLGLGLAALMGLLSDFRPTSPTSLQIFFSFRDIIDVYRKVYIHVQHRLENRLETPRLA